MTPARSHDHYGLIATVLVLAAAPAVAHDLSFANARFVEAISGPSPVPFLYLGAKHMVTGYDHILFLIGVVFFLHRLKDVVVYVSLFTLGHSLTLLGGVWFEVSVNAYLVDAVIGLSVVYKAFENIGGFDRITGRKLDMRWAVFAFGLVHGLGLSGKLQGLVLSPNGLLINLVSFNLGVEIGQVLVLVPVAILLGAWRAAPNFAAQAGVANFALMTGGFMLIGVHLFGWVWSGA